MGTRQEEGGIGSSRPPAEVRQQYNEFTPMSEWQEAEQSRLLIVHLPGFASEQLRVTTEGTDTLRIRGERPIGVSSDKRSHFQKDFKIPENCNRKGIGAKLTGGILTITFPYETTQLPPPPPTELESKTATQQTPPLLPPLRPKELEAQKTTQKSPSPPPRRSQKDIQDQQSAGKTLIPQKDQTSNTLPPPKEDQKQQPDGGIENERREEEIADDQKQKGDESLTCDEPKSVVQETVKKEEERGGTATTTAGGEEADGGWFKIEKYIEVLAAVKRLAQTPLDHDNRELLVNMGVAALITLAFGAYVYYKLHSSKES